MLDVILGLICGIYFLGWVYTTITFWKYGVTFGNRGKLAPIPASILLALFWPIIFSLTMFSKEEENGANHR